MKVLSGNINVYDLTGGKTLPYWLKGSKRKELLKKNPDLKNRKIDIIQDFYMPDLSTRILETGDGQYILAAGEYTPRIKCFDTEAHSLKFERGADNGVIDMLSICKDYSKLVMLEEDRWLELHSKGGRSLLERLPRLGSHLDYHYPDCDVYISTSGPEIDIFNLNEGRMKTPLVTNSEANNTISIHPDHHKVIATGSVNGTVELWDPQNTQRASGRITVNENKFSFKSDSLETSEVTSLCFHNLTLAVGTRNGQVLLYDMRAREPYHISEQSGEVIKCIKFHSSGNILSMSSGYLKIWNYETGDVIASITSSTELNDLCSIDNTGMLFMAADQPKIKTYFVPALGEAPKWCSHLDALVEELQEEDPTEYDDYIHVTEAQLKELNLPTTRDGVISNMNGFKVRADIYFKMKEMTSVQDEFLEKKVKNKVKETNTNRLPVARETPKVNIELFTKCDVWAESGSKMEAQITQSLLDTTRFNSIFQDPSFEIDSENDSYFLLTSSSNTRYKKKEKK